MANWTKILQLPTTSKLLNPKGYGKLFGLNFILSAYDHDPKFGLSKNFLVGITSEKDNFDFNIQEFLVEPGFFYTFKILAKQIVTTPSFESLDKGVRGCSLTHETGASNLTLDYSQTRCEYECVVRNVTRQCRCIPWNFPAPFDASVRY